MGTSSEGGKGVDMSAGRLVWVQLRNGRWWPGQVLRLEELPESLPSPKSGTPIKLLCKEDGSVDWYNVGVSARVKAFRCGEYDKCIEKAKATAAANSSKRKMKYATREDAILNALEIEAADLEIENQAICAEMKNEEKQHTVEDYQISFDHHDEKVCVEDYSSSSEKQSDIAKDILQCGFSYEDHDVDGAYEQESLLSTPNDSEDDSEGVQRMKGLDDLGMGVVSSIKRKRSQVAHVCELLKRRHQRRSVTKISHSTQVVNIPVLFQELAHPTKSLPLGASSGVFSGSGSDVIKKTFSLEYDASSNELYDVPIITKEEHIAGDFPVCPPYKASRKAHTGDETNSRQVDTAIFRVKDVNESGSTSYGAAKIDNIWSRVNNGIFNWQLKKKRSMRNSKSIKCGSMKFMCMDDEYDPSVAGATRVVDCKFIGYPPDNTMPRVKSRTVADIQVDECGGWSKNTYPKDPCIDQTANERQTRQRLLPYRQSRFSANPKYQDFPLGHHTKESSLFDVNVEVRVTYRPPNVPYVSLMSRFGGHPVVGHPLALEVLEDGIRDDYVGGSDSYSSSWELDEDLGDDTSALGHLELGLGAASSYSTERVLVEPTPVSASWSTNPTKNGFSTKKNKSLSSLARAHNKSQEKKLIVDEVRGPSLACIPLTVVFSRISEALTSSN